MRRGNLPYDHESNPIRAAIENDHEELIPILLSHVPRHGIGYSPLQAAVKIGALDIVEYILRNNVDPNAPPAMVEGRTASQLAAENGFIRIADILIKNGANINAPPPQCLERTAFEAFADFELSRISARAVMIRPFDRLNAICILDFGLGGGLELFSC